MSGVGLRLLGTRLQSYGSKPVWNGLRQVDVEALLHEHLRDICSGRGIDPDLLSLEIVWRNTPHTLSQLPRCRVSIKDAITRLGEIA